MSTFVRKETYWGAIFVWESIQHDEASNSDHRGYYYSTNPQIFEMKSTISDVGKDVKETDLHGCRQHICPVVGQQIII